MNGILLPAGAETADSTMLMGCVFAGLLGLAFGSFLNVCLSRLPEGENIAWPGSHCRRCSHVLAWWENLPLLSWILLRGRCRECRGWIGIRYPLVELAVGLLWAGCWLRFARHLMHPEMGSPLAFVLLPLFGYAVLCWLLVALAVLDAEHFWLPDRITLPGILFGLLFGILQDWAIYAKNWNATWLWQVWPRVLAILAAAGLVLFIRLAYWLVRRKEGMGLGDAKLMAMLAAWLGLLGAMESFALAILGACAAALVWIAIPAIRRNKRDWANMPLPLGTFLCLGAMTEIFRNGWLWEWWSRWFGLSL